MIKKRKLKLKRPFIIVIKIIVFIILVVLCLLFIYKYEIGKFKAIGYSEKATIKILKEFKRDYILDMGENKTLNAAFESDDYKEENLDSYSKIRYHNHKNLIKNINTLLKKGYSNNNINMILDHGNDEDVSLFAERDKVKYLEEFFTIDYAKLINYDKYVYYSDYTGDDEETTVLIVNLGIDKEAYTDAVEIDKFSTDMLVNKHHKIKDKLEPTDIIKISKEYTNGEEQSGSQEAVNALTRMINAAKNEGYGLVVNSSYRSYKEQEELCEEYKKAYGDNYVAKYLALPGYSEHQTGLSFDLGSTSSNVFANSKEYEWMRENAYKYGFIMRYTKEGQAMTEFRSEPWHYRYVGEKIAAYIQEKGITFEEYYAMFLDKS